MGASRQSFSPSDEDLEATAELPVLDVVACEETAESEALDATDHWPQPPAPGGEADACRGDAVQAPPGELAALRAQLESQAAGVRQLEQSLAERAIVAQALEARGAELAAEAERLRAEVQELRETLAAQAEVLAQREAAIAETAARAAEATSRAAQSERRLTDFDRELAARQEALESAQAELAELRRRTTAYLEALQSDRGRRDVYVSTWVELDARIAEGEARRAALEEQLRSRADRLTELETVLRVREQRIAVLEMELQSRPSGPETPGEADHVLCSTLPQSHQELEERETAFESFDLPAQAAGETPVQGTMRLLIRCEGDTEVVHVLGRRTTIGRTPENDLQVDARFISRRHAVVLAGPVHTIIEDLNSTNGVLVNDRRITRRVLKDGDRVVIGKTPFRFLVRPSPGSH